METSGQIMSPTGQDPESGSAPIRDLPHDRVDRPLAGFARDYGPSSTGWHTHERAQLLYATRGVMRISTPGASFIVPPRRALWVQAGCPHVVEMDSAIAMRALFLRADAAQGGPEAPMVMAVSPLLHELILAACAQPLEWDQAGRGGHLAALILDEIARAPTLPLGLPAPRDSRLRRLADALRAEPASALTLEAWAEHCGASVRTLTRLFREETGMSFGEWRQALRLAEASALLAGGMTPARVAAKVGYASASAFGAAYRRVFGTTPMRPMVGEGK